MIDENIITEFIPANALEFPMNTEPKARLDDKLTKSMRRFLSSGSFSGEIKENTPRLLIINSFFDPQKMGYDVIARIL